MRTGEDWPIHYSLLSSIGSGVGNGIKVRRVGVRLTISGKYARVGQIETVTPVYTESIT